jgi:hypothetical protein
MNDDNNLSAFLDGELDATQLIEIRSRAERDLAINAKLERMRKTDDLVRAAFDTPMQEGVPDRFTAAIDKGLAPIADPALSRPVAVNDNAKWWWSTGGAVAASLALGLLLGSQTLQNRDSEAALFIALNSTPSATTTSLESGQKLTPQLSFARIGGGYCRSFTLSRADTSKAGLACKAGGRWSIEALIPAKAAGSADLGYVTAEGPALPGLDEIISELRTGDPLEKVAEGAMIARGWE